MIHQNSFVHYLPEDLLLRRVLAGDEDGPAERVERRVHARPEDVGLHVEQVVQPVRLPSHAVTKVA